MITLDRAKEHCRVDADEIGDEEDALFEIYIAAALAYCEKYTGRVLAERDQVFKFKRFGGCLDIKTRPLSAVITILYTDTDGQEQTLDPANYRVVGDLIYPAVGEWFPATASPSEVVVTATVGDDDDTIEEMDLAQLLLIGHYYDNRSNVVVGTIASDVPFSVKALLDLHRVELS